MSDPGVKSTRGWAAAVAAAAAALLTRLCTGGEGLVT